MKVFNQELDCLRNLAKKLKGQIDVMESEYETTISEGYKAMLATEIVATREAMVAVEKAKKLLDGIEL